MKAVAVAFLVLIVGSYAALPKSELRFQVQKAIETRDERIVSDLIAGILEDLSRNIRDAGLDPWTGMNDLNLGLTFEQQPALFSLEAHLRNFVLAGVSNIVINHIQGDLILNSLNVTVDISLPEIGISVDSAACHATILGVDLPINFRGVISIAQVRLAGWAHIRIGLITGMSVSDLDLGFTLGDIRFTGNMNAFGTDYTVALQNFLRNGVLGAIRNVSTEIDELINFIARDVITSALP